MTRDEARREVTTALVELFELDPATITPAARFREDLELDSIDAVDLAARLQTLTGQRVEESALRSIRTVDDVTTILLQMLQARG